MSGCLPLEKKWQLARLARQHDQSPDVVPALLQWQLLQRPRQACPLRLPRQRAQGKTPVAWQKLNVSQDGLTPRRLDAGHGAVLGVGCECCCCGDDDGDEGQVSPH